MNKLDKLFRTSILSVLLLFVQQVVEAKAEGCTTKESEDTADYVQSTADALPSLSALSIVGTASEEGAEVQLKELRPDGTATGIFETYLRLQKGTFTLHGTTATGTVVSLGQGDQPGTVTLDGAAYTVTTEQVSRIRVDVGAQQISITTADVLLKGNIISDTQRLPYVGNGIWKGEVDMNYGNVFLFSDKYFYFTLNGDDGLSIKRKSGTRTEVAMTSEGFQTENIRLNRGTYTVTLNLRDYVFDLDAPIDENKISVFGSSVANGQGATSFHGYAYTYGQLLSTRYKNGQSDTPFYISGVSIGGNTTLNLMDRYDEMIHDFGRYVVFGLSLGNEWIHGASDQQKIFNQYRDNMLRLIAQARADGKVPVMMNNYTRGDFNAADYSYVKQLNLLIHEWDLPSVNVLGAIDNGSGMWADNYQNGTDVYHPNTSGHREFFYAIPPSLFDAIKAGKPLPERDITQRMTLADGDYITFSGENTLHPFAVSIGVLGSEEGVLMTFTNSGSPRHPKVGINADQKAYYVSSEGDSIVVSRRLSSTAWNTITLSHYYAQKRTLLISNSTAVETPERLLATDFIIGDTTGATSRELRELFFWRSALNADEARAMYNGKMLKSSLEIYTPLGNAEAGQLPNLAQSFNTATLVRGNKTGITAVNSDSGAMLKCEGQQGRIVVSTSSPLEVKTYTAAGQLAATATIDGNQQIDGLAPGLYVVNHNKVVVK